MNPDFEREYAENISAERADLAEGISLARNGITAAATSLRNLMGDQLFDVEFAETATGDDIAAFLDTARRAVAAADALRKTIP